MKTLKKYSFAADYMGLSLAPEFHPTACSQEDVVIEDLLSLRIQKGFFDTGGCSCRQTFVDGVLRRIVWDGDSKGKLLIYVCENGALLDVIELARVLICVLEIWSLPVPDLSNIASVCL